MSTSHVPHSATPPIPRPAAFSLPGLSGGVSGPVVLAKGPTDLVCLPSARPPCEGLEQRAWSASTAKGSPRRCGGQGDVLAGAPAGGASCVSRSPCCTLGIWLTTWLARAAAGGHTDDGVAALPRAWPPPAGTAGAFLSWAAKHVASRDGPDRLSSEDVGAAAWAASEVRGVRVTA